jgi:hypothetical protein
MPCAAPANCVCQEKIARRDVFREYSSSSIRRSRLRHSTRCSSRPVASLDEGFKSGLHGLPGLSPVDKKPRTEVRGHRVIGPSRNCMARWTAFKPQSPGSRRGLLWNRKHP